MTRSCYFEKPEPTAPSICIIVDMLGKIRTNSAIPDHLFTFPDLHRQNVQSVINNMINYNISI
jgi:hypothetical protein